MSDLIFVPDLGLLSGKSQNLKAITHRRRMTMWRTQLKHNPKIYHKLKASPFIHPQRLMPVKIQSRTPRRAEAKIAFTALEPAIQQRPFSIAGVNRKQKPVLPQWQAEEPLSNSILDVNLQSRPGTIAVGKRKHSIDTYEQEFLYEGFVNLPSLQLRP